LTKNKIAEATSEYYIYPNPSNGGISIHHSDELNKIRIFGLNGDFISEYEMVKGVFQLCLIWILPGSAST
jgi:hypothetical protein